MEENIVQQAIRASRPPPEVYSFDPPDEIVFTFGPKVPLRNIFRCQTFTEFEVKQLESLKKEIKENNIQLPEYLDDAFLVSIIHGAQYKTKKALNDLKSNIEITTAQVPNDYRVLFPKAIRILSEGFMYIHGRDKYFRPCVVLNATKLDVKKYSVEEYIEATIFLMQFAIENVLVNGKAENWLNIIEMGKMGMRELPFKSIVRMSQVLQHVYKCRLFQSYFINPPSSIYYLWKLFRPFLDKVTQTKVCIVKDGVPPELLNLFHPDQLERRYGGTAENVTQYWPPVFPSSAHWTDPQVVSNKKKHKIEVNEQEINNRSESSNSEEAKTEDVIEPVEGLNEDELQEIEREAEELRLKEKEEKRLRRERRRQRRAEREANT